MDRHEIPTHLNVEDKAFAGLTMRQLMTAAVGLGLAYGAVSEPPFPLPLRLVAAGLVLAAMALVALWRPAGRPLEDWAFVLLRYWAVPRIATWRPREVPVEVDDTAPSYEVMVPEPVWTERVMVEEEGSRAALR
ncbi:MAG TPA: PrgI family protein [Dehalococcoidia bacterium]|nr:PrgI family protein [Dehalococcoidia bacterium]